MRWFGRLMDSVNDKIMETPDLRRLYNLATLGFRVGPPYMKKYVFCQTCLMLTFFVFYLYFNGGIIPWFLRHEPMPEVSSDIYLLDLYPEADQDGLRITWQHGVNSIQSLENALKSNAMMLEADVILKGQGTDEQQMVPIVADPPRVNSDLTFDDWVQKVRGSGKGFELHFHSIEAVELTLQSLQGLGKLQIPVWLQANILNGPNAQQEPLDFARFLRLTVSHFPKSTLSLGWSTSLGEEHENHYNWTVVKAMYDLIETRSISQPLTFHVHAGLAWRSVPQLRWLMEMTGATLTLFAAASDGVTLDMMKYIRSKFPSDEVFYDISRDMMPMLEGIPNAQELKSMTNPLMGEREKGFVFRAEEWIILRADQGEKVYLGTEALVLQRGILLSRAKYDITSKGSMTVHGRVEFIETSDKLPAGGSSNDLGLEIVLSVVQGGRPGAISGFKCYIGALGHLSISTQSIPGTDAREDASMFESNQKLGCAHFTIEHLHADKIKLSVQQLKDCSSSESTSVHTGSVTLPVKEISVDAGHVAIRTIGDSGFAAIPMLKIDH